MLARSCAASFLALFFSIAGLAQTASPTPPDEDRAVLKISTTLIQIDATVTDKDGRVVTDLKPEDFEVYENGQKQTITDFSFVSAAPAAPVEPATGKNAAGETVSVPLPPIKLRPEQIRRTYALVVDDLGISFENVPKIRQSLRTFVNEQMQDGDLVAIIRTGKGIGALQSFTSDRRQLLAAIDKIKWNAYGRGGISAFEPITTTLKEDLEGRVKADGSVNPVAGVNEEKQFEKDVAQLRNENFNVGTLGAVWYVIRGMQELPGRKAVMLFSEGFSLDINNGVFDRMRVLADAANRASVVLYTLDPRGLQVPGMGLASDDIRGVFPGSRGAAALDDREASFTDSQQSLRYLAYETGGIPFVNQNDLNAGLRKVINDQMGYYLLGYQPDEETFDPKKNRFNKLEVKLRRPGLTVRHRSGFFAVTDEKMQTAVRQQQTPQQKLFGALTSPFAATDVDLNLYPVYNNDAQIGDVINALVHIDARDLQFAATADGKRKTSFDIIAMTFGDNGIPIDRLSKTYTLEVSDKVYRNMLKNGFVYPLAVPVKKPGAYQFRIALRDTASDAVGSASEFIEVPNLKKKNIALSQLILDSFSAEEWKKISLGQSRDESERSVLLDTALRQFRRGSILRFNYAVYNARSGRLKTQTRLISDGKIVFEGDPVPLGTAGQTDPLRLQAEGALTLGANLPAGSYILQIVVIDEAASRKKRFTSQFVEFEIVE